MSFFDEDTSIMRLRIAHTPIKVRTPQLSPQSMARGIAFGVILGSFAWVVLIALGIAAYRWLGY